MKKLFTILSVFLFAVTSKATIHHVNVNHVVVTFPDSFQVDVDGDAMKDFKLKMIQDAPDLVTFFEPVNGSKVSVNGSNALDSVATGQLINGSLVWSAAGSNGLICIDVNGGNSTYNGNFCGKRFYVGLQIKSGSNIYYGWAKLQSEAFVDFDIVLIDYAWSDGE